MLLCYGDFGRELARPKSALQRNKCPAGAGHSYICGLKVAVEAEHARF
jgi:hypothetical protein